MVAGIEMGAQNQTSDGLGVLKPLELRRMLRRISAFAITTLFGVTRLLAGTITVTSAGDSGTGTLRQAILTAASGDTINFSLPSGTTAITLTSDQLLINKDLTITGPGANLLSVVRGRAAGKPLFKFRIIEIDAGNVTISGLTIANGNVSASNGGGILDKSSGTLTLTGCAISGNVASSSGGTTGGYGGGIYFSNGSGTMIIANCTISGNTAAGSDYSGNQGGEGAGIFDEGGMVNIANSTISGNAALVNGGGIFTANVMLTITNSTISGNSAYFPSGIYSDHSTVNVRNTIIATNTSSSTCTDFSGTLTSQGYNLIGDDGCTTITGTPTGNQLNVDPKLGPLQDNGGPTFTQALLTGSPAIDGGNADGMEADQRGFLRPVNSPAIANATGGDGSDIGAYEVQAGQLPGCGNTVVTNSSDSGPGSLRFVVANACTGETITFASSVVSPIKLASELLINEPLTIQGTGANLLTVQRDDTLSVKFPVFHLNANGQITISGLTISRGERGIYNEMGNLTVLGCAISGNYIGTGNGFGGGILSTGHTLNVVASTISGNGALNTGGGIAFGGLANVTNSTISGNFASGGNPQQGGGIWCDGSLSLTNCTIVDNSTGGSGGGVYNNGTTISSRNTIIAKNGAVTSGPDFYGTLTSQGFNVIGNTSGIGLTPTTGDQLGVDPKIGALANNGGPTLTHALLSGSIAIDRGGSATDPVTGGPIAIDQRGFSRPVDNPAIPNASGGDGSDIGAFEVQAPTPTPTSTPSATSTATATPAATATPVSTPTPTVTPSSTPRGIPTPTPSPTATPSATPVPPTVLANIATRLRVETGDNALIGGFIVTGTQQKRIIVRAIGPSLSFADRLADPILELHDSSGALLEANDHWVDSPNKQAIIDSTIPPTNDLESAIIRSVAPGSYTAIVRGVNNGTGIGVVEVYDLDTAAKAKLANIATRGLVQTGDNVLFAGMIVVGQASQKVIIRALGPSVPVPGHLADPTLELHDANGGLLEANDNWVDSPNKQAIIDSTIPPSNDLEAAIVRTLAPASYTAIVRGANNSTGIAVVEVYALD